MERARQKQADISKMIEEIKRAICTPEFRAATAARIRHENEVFAAEEARLCPSAEEMKIPFDI